MFDFVADRMTGVGGRPEVVIEGSDYLDSGWKEYDFMYKPGNVSWPMVFVGTYLLFFKFNQSL